MMIDNAITKPFLKWAGGKRWFCESHLDLIPNEFNNYHEPFVGSGAIFFSIYFNGFAYLSDTNEWLLDTYKAVRDNWEKVERQLKTHRNNHSVEYYYKIRKKEFKTQHLRAAQFIYLNRTCWNGLFRVNKSGGFNVPIGDRSTIIYSDESFKKISDKLNGTIINKLDFTDAFQLMKSGDFAYIDPPYTVKHNYNGFVRYNEQLFSWENQEKLAECVKLAVKKGVKVLVSNADHPSIVELYENVGTIIELSRNNMLSSQSKFRGKYNELAIKCGY